MNNWNFDMDDAPRPDTGEGHRWVLLAISGANVLVVSYWIPQDYVNASGRWFNVRNGDEPLAWREFDHPSYVKKPVEIRLPAGIPGIS